MKTAKFIKKLLNDGFYGDAHLYLLSTPILGDPDVTLEHYVIVQAWYSDQGAETCIRHADENGRGLSSRKLDGTTQGILDHEQALRNAGYTVIE